MGHLDVPGDRLRGLGLFGTALAGTTLIARTRNDLQRIDYWRRILDFMREGGRWLAADC